MWEAGVSFCLALCKAVKTPSQVRRLAVVLVLMVVEAALVTPLVVEVAAVLLEPVAAAAVAVVAVRKLEQVIVAAVVAAEAAVAPMTAVVIQGAVERVAVPAVHALLPITAASSARRKRALREILVLDATRITSVTNAPHVNKKTRLESINAFLKTVALAIALAAESAKDARLATKTGHALTTPADVSTAATVFLNAPAVFGSSKGFAFRT